MYTMYLSYQYRVKPPYATTPHKRPHKSNTLTFPSRNLIVGISRKGTPLESDCDHCFHSVLGDHLRKWSYLCVHHMVLEYEKDF